MNTLELIEALDQRYGNPHAVKDNELIQLAIVELQRLYDDNLEMRTQLNEQDS